MCVFRCSFFCVEWTCEYFFSDSSRWCIYLSLLSPPPLWLLSAIARISSCRRPLPKVSRNIFVIKH